MSYMKGAGVILVSSFLFVSLFLMASFLNLSWSMEYDAFQPGAVNYATKLVNETGIKDEIQNVFVSVEFHCQTHQNYLYSDKGINLDIPCSAIDSGFDEFIQVGVENLIYEIYYDEYDCELWDCVKKSEYPFVLISEKAKDYWHSKFKLTLWVSLILFALLFLFVKKKYNAFIIAGVLTIVSSFLFRKIDLFFSLIPDLTLIDVLDLFFTRAYGVFLILLIIGIVLLVVCLLFKFFNVGFNLFKWFKKKKEPVSKDDVRKIIQEEMNGSKDKGNVKKRLKKRKKFVLFGRKGK